MGSFNTLMHNDTQVKICSVVATHLGVLFCTTCAKQQANKVSLQHTMVCYLELHVSNALLNYYLPYYKNVVALTKMPVLETFNSIVSLRIKGTACIHIQHYNMYVY